MPILTIRAMGREDEAFVLACSHVGESDEVDRCATRRVLLLRELVHRGAVVRVASLDGRPVGFVHGVPIDDASWGPREIRLMVIP